MIARIALTALLLWAGAAAAATDGYRYVRSVEWFDTGREELLGVALDSRIYATTRADFADLRLVDQAGVETPYLLEKAVETRTETRRLTSQSELLGLKKKGETTLEITLRLDKHASAANGLTVFTPLTNFDHRLRVLGSDDGKNWSSLVDNAEIYDYSRYMAVSNRDVRLPANTYRQFKVVVEEALQTREADFLELTRSLRGGKEQNRGERIELQRIPLHIERIGLWHEQTDVLPDAEKRFDYPVVGYKISRDAKERTTVIDVETRREPRTGFELKTPTRNFSRAVSVQVPVQYGIETRMEEIGGALLESVRFRDIEHNRTVVSFPERRQERYRILIHDQDNPPLDITGVAGVGNGYNLLFLPAPGKTYSIRYGAEKAERPDYDTASIKELLRRGYKTTTVRLGTEVAATSTTESWDLAELLNSKAFLGTVVAFMVAVLGWSLLRVGKQVGQLPKQ